MYICSKQKNIRRKNSLSGIQLIHFHTFHHTTGFFCPVNVSTTQTTPKGLRHAYGILQVTGKPPLPLHILADVMEHSSTATTEIYTRVLGGEKNAFEPVG